MTGLQGRVFGGYQLAEQLPGGGIAEVYRARPTMSGGREVVVKVIHPEFAHQPGFLPNFRHIVQTSGRLATHPHILPLVSSGEENGYLYLITPYVAAGTLKDWLAGGGRLGAADVAPFFRQLCDALGHAHSLGIIHGNLKPSNVLLFEGKHVLLGDFGMLWDMAHMDMDHAGPGTEAVAYVAPEVAAAPATQLSDVYSVGALLFATITGRPPFAGATPTEIFAAHARQPIPRLTPGSGALPPPAMQALDAVIQHALAKRPEDRFPSAAAMAQAIEVSVRQAAAAAPQTGPGMMGWPPPPGVPQSGMVFPVPGAPAPAPQPFAPPGSAFMPGFGAGLPGAGFAPPAAGFGPGVGAALETGSAPLQPLDPPFPPLHTGELIEGQMEQGRVGAAPFSGGDLSSIPTSAQLSAWNGALAALEDENTMRVPAPPAPGPMLGSTPGDGGGVGGVGAPDGANASGEAALNGERGVRGFAPSRGGLGQRLGALQDGTEGPDGRDGQEGEDEEPGPQSMPAIRLDGAPPPGFMVAGGGNAPGASGPNLPAAGGEGAAFSVAGGPHSFVSGGPAGERAAEPSLPSFSDFGQSAVGFDGAGGNANGYAPPGDMGEQGDRRPPEPWSSRGHSFSAGAETGERPFSATALELPRLTGHDLSGIPSNWQEYIGDGGGRPGNGGHGNPASAFAPAASSAGRSASAASWPSSPGASGGHAWGGDAEQSWEGQHASGKDTWAESALLSASLPALSGPVMGVGTPAGAAAVAPAGRGQGWLGRGQRAESMDLANEGFFDAGYDDTSGWSRGLARLRGGRYHSLRKTALFATLILLFDLCALVLARPELCPTSGCLLIDQQVHQLAPTLYTNPALFPLSAQPATVTIHVAAGSSATGKVRITNTSDAPVTWQAKSGLPWLTLSPATGTLKAGANTALTLTVKSTGIKPAAYPAEVTVAVGSDTLRIPVQVTVAASGQRSSASPPTAHARTSGAPSTFAATSFAALPGNSRAADATLIYASPRHGPTASAVPAASSG